MKQWKFKSTPVSPLFSVELRVDKIGCTFYSVIYKDNEGVYHSLRFEKFSSIVDFISNNF